MLAKRRGFLHYYPNLNAQDRKSMSFARFYFHFYFSYSSPKAVEKR
jgi:hypothetical protein